MKRRSFWGDALAGWALCVAAGSGSAWAGNPPGHTLSLGQIEQAIAQRFPLTLGVGGLLDLRLLSPRLRLIPALNRIGSAWEIEAGGPALRHRYSGWFDLDFLLRYEPSDRTIRAHQPRVQSLRLAGLPPRPAELIDAYGPLLAEQALQDLVLHQLAARDLALPDALGLEPDTLTVTAQGVVIAFKPKPLRPPT
jgi:hypothetical protein